jgi:hypothetical protein
MQIAAPESAADTFEPMESVLPMKDGVDGLDGPALVQDDQIVEQVLLVIHNARIVQVPEQFIGGRHLSLLRRTQAVEMRITQGAIPPVCRRTGCIFRQIGQQRLLHVPAAYPDGTGARVGQFPLTGFADEGSECVAAVAGFGAEVDLGAWHRHRGGRPRPVVAFVFYNDYGTVRTGVTDIVKPVGQRKVFKMAPVCVIARLLCAVAIPDEQEHRPAAQKQGMGPVVNVLSTEVPDIDPEVLPVLREVPGDQLDAVC